MRILDRTIVFRFAWNFMLLFTLLFVFAALVDVTLQLEQYLKVAAQSVASSLPMKYQFLRPMTMGRRTRSAWLLSMGRSPRVV